MSKFTHIIFDLDGTLTDNTRGIGNSIKYALKQMHIDNYSVDILEQFIGPPLQWGFKNVFGMNDRNTELAVGYFREYYAEKGLFENEPYPGIQELLEELNNSGKKMYIATAKYEKYAQKIMEHFEFDKYIIQLNGADYSGRKATKTTIIANLLEVQKLVASNEIVMVGDTVYDIEGGKENGLSTIAVNYGFGKEPDLQKAGPNFFAENVEELYEILTT
ncbi:MAG: HAD-IA family hydrolase [Draconibacterium sp.]|nr:HAD-IA family hydrolase [Draconibacterium sp.]